VGVAPQVGGGEPSGSKDSTKWESPLLAVVGVTRLEVRTDEEV
jgi:hypothetical protein